MDKFDPLLISSYIMMMSSRNNVLSPVKNVRETCFEVMRDASHVSIKMMGLIAFADKLLYDGIVKEGQAFAGVEWDACGWHYNGDAAAFGPLTCQYIFVLDSLNFCFWEVPGLEYDTLAIALRDAILKDPTCFSAERLANITSDEISSMFPSDKQMPNMTERVRVLQELGQVILQEFDGHACNLVAKAKGSAVRLVELIIRYLPGFRDCSIYKGYRVDFYKRAQILVGDLWAAYRRHTHDTSAEKINNIYQFDDISQLTMFADYRVPQILRHYHVIAYDDHLAKKVDCYEAIAYGSEEETEIRAATVIAVDMLHDELKNRAVDLKVIEIDWLLWQLGEAAKDSIEPHHRTRTIYY